MIAQPAETQYRLTQRTQLYLRLSRLRYHALPEQVHATAERGLAKEQLLILCDGMFIEKGENVLIAGALQISVTQHAGLAPQGTGQITFTTSGSSGN